MMSDSTPAFSGEGVRELRGFREWLSKGGGDALPAKDQKARWNDLPYSVQEHWRARGEEVWEARRVSEAWRQLNLNVRARL